MPRTQYTNLKKARVDFCRGKGWVERLSDCKEEQEKLYVWLTHSQPMPHASNSAGCLAFSSSCLLLMCHWWFLFLSIRAMCFHLHCVYIKGSLLTLGVSPASCWSQHKGTCSTTARGPAAPGAAPAKLCRGSWLHRARGVCFSPRTSPAHHSADWLAPDLRGYSRAL